VPRRGADGKPADWLLAASHSGGLHAVLAADGAHAWTYEAEALGEPLVVGDRVYVLSAEGSLHVLRLQDGQRVFARKMPGTVAGTLAVLPDQGVLLVPSESGLDLVDMETGIASQRLLTETGFAARPVVWDRNVYTISNGSVVYAFTMRHEVATSPFF
jgi:outer membrane protein assembly factor BamB